MADVTLTFVSGKDDVAIAVSIANHLGSTVVILRPDGTKNHVVPLDAVKYTVVVPDPSRNTDGNDPSPQQMQAAIPPVRGPFHHDEDEIGFGEPYDSFGG